MVNEYWWFFLLAFVAEILGTVSGFGSSILFVPIAAMFFDFKTVLGVTAIFHVFSNLSKIALFRKGIKKDVAFKLGVPAIIFVIIGAYITTILPTKNIELIMNVVLVFLALFLTINFNKSLKQTNANLYLGGSASGFLAGIAGTGGDDDPTLLVLRNDKTVWWLNGIGAGLLTSTGSTYSTSFQRAFFSMGEFIPISRLVANSNATYHQCCLFPQDGTVLLSGGGNSINNSMAGGPPLSSTIYVPNEINFYGEPIVDCYFQNTTDGTTVYCNTFLTTLAGKVYGCGTKYTALAGQLANKTTFVPLCLPFQ